VRVNFPLEVFRCRHKTAVLAEERVRDGVFLATIRDPDIRLVVVVLNLRTTTSQKCESVPRRARIYGS